MQSFFPNAGIVGFVKSEDNTGTCVKATTKDLANFQSSAELEKIRDLELVAGELTDNEVYAFAHEIWWEVQAKLQRYSNMYRHTYGEEQPRRFRLCPGSLEELYAKTSIYSRKDEVFDAVAELFEVRFEKPASQGCGVWAHNRRAPLDQTHMSTPTDVLCGIKRLENVEQPDFLVRAGALATLSTDQRKQGRRRRLVVQRVGMTICVANDKYQGDLNMNSQGLQLERVLCGMSQYLQPGTEAFNAYAHKQVFVIRQGTINVGASSKRLCTYYHAFAQSNDKKWKGRIQVDSSGDPGRYRLRSGASLKDTCFQMWARGQRFLHHCEWDRCKELLMVRLQVCEVDASEKDTDEAQPFAAHACENPDEPNIPFEHGAIQVCLRNNNRVLKRPLALSECCTIEELAAQAFEQPGAQNEAAEAQSRIEGSLGRIQEALDAQEVEDGTADHWFSFAYYVDQLKLHHLEEGSIFEERSVSELDRPLQRDRLRAFQAVVHPEYAQPARGAPRPGTGGGQRGGDGGEGRAKGGKGAAASAASGRK